jgi:hypothetical protein
MKLFKALACIAGFTGLLAGGSLVTTAAANASTWNTTIGTSNYCSLSYPNQYMLQHSSAITYLKPASTRFTSHHTGFGWEDAYWTTGYGHSLNSSGCNTHITPTGYRNSLPAPTPVGTPYYATLNVAEGGGFNGNLGWDIWLEPPGSDGSNLAMASGGQAHTEVVIITGGLTIRSGGTVAAGRRWAVADQHLPAGYEGHAGGWHRIYYKLVGQPRSVSNLNLSAVIADAVNHHGVPRTDKYYAIDAGAEFTRGAFAVNSYQLQNSPLIRH